MNLVMLSLYVIFTLFVIIFWMVWPMIIGAIFVPTPNYIVEKMFEIADVNEDDILIDMGSGDGRIILDAATQRGARSIGIEADPLRVIWSRLRILSKGYGDRVKVIWGNFFSTSVSKATVVTVYQGQSINKKLRAKFQRELSPGARVVSYLFTFDGWEPVKRDTEENIYLYVMENTIQ